MSYLRYTLIEGTQLAGELECVVESCGGVYRRLDTVIQKGKLMQDVKWVRIINADSRFYNVVGKVRARDLEAARRDLSVMIEVFIPDFLPTRFSLPEFEVMNDSRRT